MPERLVLLCGLLCDEAAWQPVAERLGGEAAILHFAGFSSIEAMVAHVLASVEGPLLIAGHSMGGRVAIEAARQTPERVRGLALLNIGVHGVTAQEPAGRQRHLDIARDQGMAALADAWLPPMMDADADPDPALMADLKAMVLRNSRESFEGQIHALLNRPDAEAALRETQVPTLLLSATGDRWSPPEQHRAMLELVPHARLVIVEGAGHMAPVEQPDAVAKALRQWIASAQGLPSAG